MRTSELAREAGVHTQTLRYYERIGLIDPPPRTTAGYRDYPESTVRLLRFVLRAKELGFQLDEVEELLHLDDGGPAACEAARELAESRMADLDRRIHDLRRMRDSLSALADTCHRPHAERSCPLLESLDGAESSNA